MKNQQTDPISPLAIALGAEPLEVTYLDGTKGTVAVRLLTEPEKDYPAFLGAIEDDRLLAEFAAKQDPGWGATLHPSSLLDLVERAMALNFHLVRRWAEHRTRTQALLRELGAVVPAASASPKR